MTKSLYFTFGIHNHQPVGNFPEIFEQATQAAYRPFLEVLEAFPEVKMSFHFTGILYQWLEKHQPDMLELLSRMVQRGQIELLTGGFYEPILPMIPDRDKIGQIQKLTTYLREVFGYSPRGMWVAERVWEPHLAKPIAEAGVQYVIVDDKHFKTAGLTDEELFGYYVTEEQGVPLAIFPISEAMRYLVPFKLPEESIEYFRSVATEGGERLVVMADDGEKFGVWPGTHQWVFKEKWLEKFFQALRDNQDWVKIVTFSEYMQEQRSLGPVYLPTASYFEMMEWALPAKRSRELQKLAHQEGSEPYRPFLRGGFWRVFLAKYAESNNMHKKMLYVGDKINRLPEGKRAEALDALWTGQCNCAYWHGVFGGLYLNHLRTAVYENLLRAERLVDEQQREDDAWVEVEPLDFFRDGSESLLVSTAPMNLYFNLGQGGSLFELDDKRKLFNLLNTMTRREEAYHDKLLQAEKAGEEATDGSKSIHDIVRVKEKGLAERLFYDWYRRSALIDHFLGEEATLEQFSRAQYAELGDFVNQSYEARWKKSGRSALRLTLSREGGVWQGERRCPLKVEKEITIRAGKTRFPIQYTLTNQSGEPLRVRFGVEFGFALQAGDTPDRYYVIAGRKERPRLGSAGETADIREIALVEEWLGLRVEVKLEGPATFWRFPIETISNSEDGFERVYQSSVVLALQEATLPPEQPWKFGLTLAVVDTGAG